MPVSISIKLTRNNTRSTHALQNRRSYLACHPFASNLLFGLLRDWLVAASAYGNMRLRFWYRFVFIALPFLQKVFRSRLFLSHRA